MVMITTSNKSGNKDEFGKGWGPIKSPFNIHKFYLCIPISLEAQVQTYVNNLKTNKGECNLDGMSCIIFIENVFFS